MLGATGTVGTKVLKTFLKLPEVTSITLFGRNSIKWITEPHVKQYKVNIFEPDSYGTAMNGCSTAIYTLGIGQPSKVADEELTWENFNEIP
jgi:putative NADH-flavin reductase